MLQLVDVVWLISFRGRGINAVLSSIQFLILEFTKSCLMQVLPGFDSYVKKYKICLVKE